MKKNTRRTFLGKLGLTVGAITLGKDLMNAEPVSGFFQIKEGRIRPKRVQLEPDRIDFRYAPADWQSTYCFPDDPHKSLVGKHGELRYGHSGIGADFSFFPHVVSVGLQGRDAGKYVEQKLEAPAIPIIITRLEWDDVVVQLTSFASRNEDEGRVDNLLIEFQPKVGKSIQCTPEIVLKSASKFLMTSEDDYSIVQFDDEKKTGFMIVDSPIVVKEEEGIHRYQLRSGTASASEPLKFFARFPQENQSFDQLEDGLEEPEELLVATRAFWQAWKPTDGRVSWRVAEPFQNFLVASARNMEQSSEIKNGKKLYQVGPTVYRGLWMVDGNSLMEAARYMGHDREAQSCLEAIWDRQDSNGLITGGAGEAHWKDTAVAIYSLMRQAELSQDWTYFNEMYPDAFKGLAYLRQLRDKAMGSGTLNGKYKLLPRGFGDSGIGGIRSELTNTLWLLVALKYMTDVSERLFLQRKFEIREFDGEVRRAFFAMIKKEMRQHRQGFKYLPMLMSDDPGWLEADVRKQPRPQVAQIYLSQAIYPGMIFPKEHEVVSGHLALMRSILKEDIPIETGWLTDNAAWPYNAAIAAQAFLWMGMTDVARRLFVGFLNHASPLYAWREEQSLQDAATSQFIGDMPHNWASAECIRYLRHMLVLEDESILRLFDGVGPGEMFAEKPISLTYTPTRWGRISVTLEPVDKKSWRTQFKREDYDEKTMPKLGSVELPGKLPGAFYLDKVTGAEITRVGLRVVFPATATNWECTWRHV